MTDKKAPTIAIPNLKSGTEKDGNAFFVMRLVQQPVIPQDVYSPAEVARLLGIKKGRVYDYARSPRKPLPLRKWRNGARGSFVLREELIEWLREATDLPEEHYPEC